jgi:arsenite methyltransferase
VKPFGHQQTRLPARQGDYGFDAPYVPMMLGASGLGLGSLLLLGQIRRWRVVAGLTLAMALQFLLGTASFVYTTRCGKFAAWEELLLDLGLQGDERVLDLGCGRGAVLLMAAQLVPRGKAVGVDLWRTADQSGNSPEVTSANARAEGVADLVELETADLRDLPFAAATFDAVVSSQAIHNIPSSEGRARAIDEALRVLKPGGRLMIADFRSTDEYARRLEDHGLLDVEHRRLGWRFWYGGPWTASKLVSVRKPV